MHRLSVDWLQQKEKPNGRTVWKISEGTNELVRTCARHRDRLTNYV